MPSYSTVTEKLVEKVLEKAAKPLASFLKGKQDREQI